MLIFTFELFVEILSPIIYFCLHFKSKNSVTKSNRKWQYYRQKLCFRFNFFCLFTVFMTTVLALRRHSTTTLSIKNKQILGIVALSITTFNIKILSITTFSKIKPSIWPSALLNITCRLCWVLFMVSAIYAECHLCWMSFMLNVIYAECHLCSVSFMLSVIYAEHTLDWMSFMLSDILCWVTFYAECHLCWAYFRLFVIYTEWHFMLSIIYAECPLCWISFMQCNLYREWCSCWILVMFNVI